MEFSFGQLFAQTFLNSFLKAEHYARLLRSRIGLSLLQLGLRLSHSDCLLLLPFGLLKQVALLQEVALVRRLFHFLVHYLGLQFSNLFLMRFFQFYVLGNKQVVHFGL